MGGTPWTLRITLPEPDDGAALHLALFLATRAVPDGISRGTSTIRAHYPTEQDARAAMALVLSQRPEVRCSVAASGSPGRG